MDSNQQHPLLKLARYAPIAEKIVLVALAVGVILNYANLGGMAVIRTSLALLAIVFFLEAFLPVEIPDDKESGDFSHLLVLTIMPKIVLISAAVSTFGIFAFLMNFGNKGYLQPLLAGATTTFAAFLIYLYGVIKSMNGVNSLFPLFYRALPFAMLATYIFIQNRN